MCADNTRSSNTLPITTNSNCLRMALSLTEATALAGFGINEALLKGQGVGVKTIKALGLTKRMSSVVKEDNDMIRGMINTVNHLIVVEKAK